MKIITRTGFLILLISTLFSCKKTGQPGGGNNATGYFFKNTEWTGTCHTISQQYDRPAYARFNSDSSVTVYSTFDLILNSVYTPTDSLRGTITAIDSLADGGFNVKLNFPLIGEQQIWVLHPNSLMSGSALSSNNSFAASLEKCPATMASLKSTSWSSRIMTGGGPTDGMYAYPDVATFAFGDISQEFTRNGHIVTYTPTDTIQALLMSYKQIGPRVYFSGFNESSGLLIGYFGVLSPGADTMWVDTRAKNSARLPNYLQTIYWYGPPGVTPVIYKL